MHFIVQPLAELCEAFRGPERLIKKRYDKSLDYSAAMQQTNEGAGKPSAVSRIYSRCAQNRNYT